MVKKIDSRILPGFFTVANLLFGFLSLIYALKGEIRSAVAMIMLSVLMDSLDGKVARKLKADSDFGKELDSLSDLISFGLAPAIIVYIFVYKSLWPFWGIWVSALFTICGAIRLARFNTLGNIDYFIGVPITFSGGFVALLLLFTDKLIWVVYPVVMVILSIFMISPLQVPKLGK